MMMMFMRMLMNTLCNQLHANGDILFFGLVLIFTKMKSFIPAIEALSCKWTLI